LGYTSLTGNCVLLLAAYIASIDDANEWVAVRPGAIELKVPLLTVLLPAMPFRSCQRWC
jgi:hypothetical protein